MIILHNSKVTPRTNFKIHLRKRLFFWIRALELKLRRSVLKCVNLNDFDVYASFLYGIYTIPGWTLQRKYSVSETKISFLIKTWKNWAKNGQNTRRPLKSVVVNYVLPGEGSSSKSNIDVYSQHTVQNWYCIFLGSDTFSPSFETKNTRRTPFLWKFYCDSSFDRQVYGSYDMNQLITWLLMHFEAQSSSVSNILIVFAWQPPQISWTHLPWQNSHF